MEKHDWSAANPNLYEECTKNSKASNFYGFDSHYQSKLIVILSQHSKQNNKFVGLATKT